MLFENSSTVTIISSHFVSHNALNHEEAYTCVTPNNDSIILTGYTCTCMQMQSHDRVN